MIYSSERYFKFWSFTCSHNTLILRSPLFSPDETEEGYDPDLTYNIDIEFTGVDYLNIPSSFKGIEVEVLLHDTSPFEPYLQIKGNRVFKITSGENIFHIVAAFCTVGTSSWISADRMSNLGLNYDTILAEL